VNISLVEKPNPDKGSNVSYFDIANMIIGCTWLVSTLLFIRVSVKRIEKKCCGMVMILLVGTEMGGVLDFPCTHQY
jgi:hypothetical protein